MSTLTKEQVKDLIRGNNFNSVSDVSAYLKDIFKDMIQELLEAELDAKLGYTKMTQIEAFHRIFENECLGIHEFCSFGHAYAEVARFMKRYNTKRLHSSLKYKAPEIFYELNKGREIESMVIHL